MRYDSVRSRSASSAPGGGQAENRQEELPARVDAAEPSARVAVCIPTYSRPEFLRDAVLSCLRQTILPDEIVIGDDSLDDRTASLIEDLQREAGVVSILYAHNSPSKGQAANVDSLFSRATADRVVLLHDDDLLMEDAIEALGAAFAFGDVNAAYGKQYILTHDGEVDAAASERLNVEFLKSAPHAAARLTPIEAAVSQQFPNDAFMLDRRLALRTPYDRPGVGDACDFMFALNLAEAGCRSVFVDRYTAAYRTTRISISNQGSDASFVIYERMRDYPLPASSEPYRRTLLERHVRPAIVTMTERGLVRAAWRAYLSPEHRRYVLTAGGLRRLLRLIVRPLRGDLA